MKRLFLLAVALMLSGCVGTPAFNMNGAPKQAGIAKLEYTSTGLTSEFRLGNLATGTYKSLGAEGGLVVHTGTQNISLGVNAAEKWSILATSDRTAIKNIGLDVDIKNPYVASVKKDGRKIGSMYFNVPAVDGTKQVLKYVGLDSLMHRNLALTGQARIYNNRLLLDPVYTDLSGEKHSSPIGYKVTSTSKKLLGMIQVDHNPAGGQILQVMVVPGLRPVTRQGVVSMLLVAGYAI
ncbi:MAG TPA: hypothetical protein VJ934_06355 [Desulfomicrobiaceae bacterium]|nr:hypothetical protein [Desulfomicrobiaceae bacterium]